MRQIVVVKLENDTKLNIIDDVEKPEDAKNNAIKNFKRLVGDKSLEVNSKCKIISHEKWEQERVSSNLSGNKRYRAMFYMNGSTQCVDIAAVSVKSTYNNIRIKYGLEDNIFMLIYDMTQLNKKKSATEYARTILNDNTKITEQFKEAANKISDSTKLVKCKQYIKVTYEMFIATNKKAYNGNIVNIMIPILATIVYYNKPCDYNYDIVKNGESISDEQALMYMIGQIRPYLKEFREWEETQRSCKQQSHNKE